mmetsp:Transcript_11788/g.31799  ORF Transcript_11788/g.31799 Transcript_11788/m.31799 type:complete len:260 (-) Transcript_11788:446-1225(-)
MAPPACCASFWRNLQEVALKAEASPSTCTAPPDSVCATFDSKSQRVARARPLTEAAPGSMVHNEGGMQKGGVRFMQMRATFRARQATPSRQPRVILCARFRREKGPPEPDVAVFRIRSHLSMISTESEDSKTAPPSAAVLFVRRLPVILTLLPWPTNRAPPSLSAVFDEKTVPSEKSAFDPVAHTAPPLVATFAVKDVAPLTESEEFLAPIAPQSLAALFIEKTAPSAHTDDSYAAMAPPVLVTEFDSNLVPGSIHSLD